MATFFFTGATYQPSGQFRFAADDPSKSVWFAIDAPTIETRAGSAWFAIDGPVFEDRPASIWYAIDAPVFDNRPASIWYAIDAPVFDIRAGSAWFAVDVPVFDNRPASAWFEVEADAAPPTSAGIGVDAAVPIAIRYRAYLQSNAPLASVELPLSALSVTMETGQKWRLTASIPNGTAFAAAIAARHDGATVFGELLIYRERVFADGAVSATEFARGFVDTIPFSDTSYSRIVTINASRTAPTATPAARALMGSTYSQDSAGRTSFVCPLDPAVRPGDTVTVAGKTITVASVGFSVGASASSMTLSDAV